VTFPAEPFPTIETVPTRPFPANPNHREATETSQTEPGRSRPPRQTEPILWSLRHAFPSQPGPRDIPIRADPAQRDMPFLSGPVHSKTTIRAAPIRAISNMPILTGPAHPPLFFCI